MASFTEQATLVVKDQSSAAIKKINNELKKLAATAKSIKNTTIKIDVNTGRIKSATAELKALNAQLAAIKANARGINLSANAKGLQAAANTVDRLNRSLQQLRSAGGVQLNVGLGNINRAITRVARLQNMLRNMPPIAGGAGAGAGGRGGRGGRVTPPPPTLPPLPPPRAAPPPPPPPRGRGGLGGGGGGGGPIPVTVVNVVRTVGGGGGGGGGGGAGGGGRPAPLPGMPGYRTAGGLLTGIGGAFTAHQIGAAVGRAIKEGTQDAELGETSLRMKQLDRVYGLGAEQAVRAAIAEQEREQKYQPGGAFFNRGQRTFAFSEVLGVTQMQALGEGKFDLSAAKHLSADYENLTEIMIVQGKTMDEAREQAISYIKGLEQAGRLKDPETGKFDPARADYWMGFLRQMMPTIGKEMTGDFFKNIVKYLSSSKQPIGKEALGAVLLMGEEMGTRAAVGYNQMVKQLSGVGTPKEQLRWLEQNKLITTERVQTGQIGKRKTFSTKVKDVVDKDLLQTNAPAWIQKHIVPILEKEGQEAARKEAAKAGKKLTDTEVLEAGRKWAQDPQKIYDLTLKAVGERTAREGLASFLQRNQEYFNQLDEAFKRSGTRFTASDIMKDNMTRAVIQMQNQFQGVTGQMMRTMAPVLTPAMQAGSQKMTEFAAKVAAGTVSSDDIGNMAGAMLPVALSAGLGAMATGSFPAAVASFASAAALLAVAAANLMKFDLTKFFPKPPKPGEPVTPAQQREEIERKAAEDASAAIAKKAEQLTAETLTFPRTAAGQRKRAENIKRLQQELDMLIKQAAAQKIAAQAAADAAAEEANRQRQTFAETAEAANLKVPVQIDWLGADSAAGIIRQLQTLLSGTDPIIIPWALNPTPLSKQPIEFPHSISPTPGTVFGPPTRTPEGGTPTFKLDPTSPPVKVKTVTTPSMKPQAPGATTPQQPLPPFMRGQPPKSWVPQKGAGLPGGITLAVDTSNVKQVFDTAFSDGATKIGGTGEQIGADAISAIASGSGTAGQIYGNAALGVIQAGVANMSINVNANVNTTPGTDKGTQA